MFKKTSSHGDRAQRPVQRGFALLELLLTVAIVAVLVGIGAGIYSYTRAGIGADDQASKTIALVADVQKNWRNNTGGYTGITPAQVNQLSLVQKPLKWDGTNIDDAYGNPMTLSGGTTTFSITVGGTVAALNNADCASIANRLAAGVANNINIGAAATLGSGATAGTVTGGNVFKVGNAITQTSLTTGCNETSPVIAASFR